MTDNLIENLEQRLSLPLPGQSAQYEMAHAVRQNTQAPPADAREAGVLALLFPKQKEWHLTLILRQNNNPNDRHGGQVSFPGGKRDEEDIDLRATAVREAEEEVGIDRRTIQLLGALSELYIPVSNFKVQPYVGFLDFTPTFVPQPTEVKAILEVPFQRFLEEENRRVKDLELYPQLTLRDVPYFDVVDQTVWGATAMMISELVAVLRK
ncbi:MAG: CoA pyrophosphatase [Bacteroidota bacterium]